MASYLEIFTYLQLLAFCVWFSDAVAILTSRTFFISRKLGGTCESYSVQQHKISLMYRRNVSRGKSSRLGYVRNDDISNSCVSVDGKFQYLAVKRSEKCFHLFNEIQSGKSLNKNTAFTEQLLKMRGREIAEAMLVSVKFRRARGGVDYYSSHLLPITQRLEQFPSDRWRSKDIAHMLYGMHSIKHSDIGAIEFLRVITRIIEESIQIRINEKSTEHCQRFTAREISMILYGMQGLRSVNEEVRRLLAVLAPRILEVPDKLDTIAVGQALFGMHRMSSDCSEVRAVIEALVYQVKRCDQQFDSQAVSNTIIGMQGMSSDHEVVRNLLSVLTLKIRECPDKMSAVELSGALCGLRRMRSEHSEVRSLLLALTPKVLECLEVPSEVMLGNMFSGLQGMSTDHVEVLDLMRGIKQHAARCVQQLSADSLSKALHGLQRAESAHSEVREIVQELTGKMNKSQDVFMADNIGTSLYGMQRMSADHEEVRFLLSALQSKIVKCRAHPDSIDVKVRKFITFSKKDLPHMRSNAIADALHGLQNMDSDYEEVRRILFVLAPLLKNCVDQFSTSALTNALYGMKRMRSDHSEVRTILSYLTPRLSTWKDPSATDLGLGLKGLGSMSCSHREVRDIVEAFVPNIERCQEIFSSKSVADAMSGLRCMSSETAAVRDLLLVLVPKIQGCIEVFSAKDICRTLSSLRGLSSEYSEVLTLLLVTVLKVKNCEEDLTAAMVSDVLYGLQGMSNECFEVRTLLFAIIPRVKKCQGVFTGEDIGKALWGMQGLIGKVESQSLLEFFYERVQVLDFKSLDTAEIISLSRYLTLTLLVSEFKVHHKEQHSKWSDVNYALLEELNRRRTSEVTSFDKGITVTTDSLITYAPIISDADDDSGLISRCLNVFKDNSVRIFCNSVLHVLFDSDITLQVTVPDTERASGGLSVERIKGLDSGTETSDYFIINIEIDNGKYDEKNGLRYHRQRDKYLKSKGIFTVRVRSIDIKCTGPSVLDSWLLRMISTFTERHKERKEQALYDESIYDDIR